MKKILLLILLAVLTLNAHSQVKFKGISVKGNTSNFEMALEEKGFKYDSDRKVYHGQWNYRMVDVKVVTGNAGKLSQVQVFYHGYKIGEENLNIVKRDYNELLSAFEKDKAFKLVAGGTFIRDNVEAMQKRLDYGSGKAYETMYESSNWLNMGGSVFFRVEADFENYSYNVVVVFQTSTRSAQMGSDL